MQRVPALLSSPPPKKKDRKACTFFASLSQVVDDFARGVRSGSPGESVARMRS